MHIHFLLFMIASGHQRRGFARSAGRFRPGAGASKYLKK
jgi:hypothetical protein